MGVGMPEYVLLFRKPQTDKARSTPMNLCTSCLHTCTLETDAHQLWRTDGVSIGEIADAHSGRCSQHGWQHACIRGGAVGCAAVYPTTTRNTLNCAS